MEYKCLLTVRDLSPDKKVGGVGNYYRGLKNEFKNEIEYHFIGKRYKDHKNISLRLAGDYISLWGKLKSVNVLVVNPSLNSNCIFRDGISTILAKLRGKKYIVFFRGWAQDVELKVEQSYLLKKWLQTTFLNADHIIVLSSNFKKKIIEWGYKGSVSIETTVVDEKLLTDFTLNYKKREDNKILFLSRIEKVKGIFEALEAVNILMEKNRDIQFTIAGNGSSYEDLKTHISTLDTDRITLKGYVKGEEKAGCFSSANMFLFPSVHGEGMPNSILEAMAFGLPVLTTRVGGIPDFFEEGKMGLFLDSREPEHIAEKIEYLLDRPELMKEMGEYNYNYAKEHFYANKVAARLEKIIDDVVEGRV